MRQILAFIVAIFVVFGFFGSTALAGAGGPICGSGFTTLTPHSRYYYGACDHGKVALLDYTPTGELQVAHIVNTAKAGLTPRYNKLVVSLDNQQGASRQIWEMSFSFNFISMTSVPGYLMTVVDFGAGNEGFMIWDSTNPSRMIPLTGTSYQSNLIGATYNEISAFAIDFDGEIYTLMVAINRSNKTGHQRGELWEYRLGPGGRLVTGRNWQTSYFVDDFAPTYGGNIEVAMHDPQQNNRFRVAYLATDQFDHFELIGIH